MEKGLCSVIIPTYNYERYIERVIENALTQTYPKIEVIVVDDGSTDGTSERVRKYEGRIVYHRKQNGGIASSWNAGLKLCNGEFVQFLDADDWLGADKIEKQVQFLNQHPDVDIVYSDYLFINDSGEALEDQTRSYMGSGLKTGDDVFGRLIKENFLTVHCTLIRSRLIEAGFYFDDQNGKLNEDWEYWLRLAAKGYKFEFLPGPVAYYLKHGSSLTDGKNVNYVRRLLMYEKVQRDPGYMDAKARKKFVAYQSEAFGNIHYNRAEFGKARKWLSKAVMNDWHGGGEWKSVKMFFKSFYHQLVNRKPY